MITLRGINASAKTNLSLYHKVRRVDFAGSITLITAVFTLILGLDLVTNKAWAFPFAMPLLFSSVSLFAILFLVESRLVADPVIPVKLLAKKPLLVIYTSMLFSAASWMSVLFNTPLLLQTSGGLDAAESALRLIPGVAGVTVGSLVTGILTHRSGRYRNSLLAAFILQLLASIALSLTRMSLSSLPSVYELPLGLMFAGLGNGIAMSSLSSAIIASTSQTDQAVTISVTYLIRNLGYIVGISISSALILARLTEGLSQTLGNDPSIDVAKVSVRTTASEAPLLALI